jgi:hypothetical protein
LVLSFFTSQGADRVALADESYKQHNPAFKKRAENEKISDYEEFKKTFMAQAGRGARWRWWARSERRASTSPG